MNEEQLSAISADLKKTHDGMRDYSAPEKKKRPLKVWQIVATILLTVLVQQGLASQGVFLGAGVIFVIAFAFITVRWLGGGLVKQPSRVFTEHPSKDKGERG